MSCAPSRDGLRCRHRAGDANGNIRTTFGPSVAVPEGPYAVELELDLRWGISGGVAVGLEGGRWTGALVSVNPVSTGSVWVGSWDGQRWRPSVDWTRVLESGVGRHTIRMDVDGDHLVTTVDGHRVSDFHASVPLTGAIAPVFQGQGSTTIRKLTVTPAPRPAAPPVAAAAPPSAPSARPLPGKFEWTPQPSVPEDWYGRGSANFAVDGDRLLATSSSPDAGVVEMRESTDCGRSTWSTVPIRDLPAPTTSFRVRLQSKDLLGNADRVGVSSDGGGTWTETTRFAGRHVIAVEGPKAVYVLDGTDLYVTKDGADWALARTIGLDHPPRFGRLLACDGWLVLVDEDLQAWGTFLPEP